MEEIVAECPGPPVLDLDDTLLAGQWPSGAPAPGAPARDWAALTRATVAAAG